MKNLKKILTVLAFILNTAAPLTAAEKVDMSTFFKQKTPVQIIQKRLDLFRTLLTGQNVLHVGCTDYPIFNPSTNLHLELAEFVGYLAGCDTDQGGLNLLKEHYNGTYFTNLSDVTGSYHYVLIPEVIEHIGNVEDFLHLLDHIQTDYYIITAPNALFIKNDQIFTIKNNVFYEEVHPDHNCWYSPLTLRNCIEKYTTWQTEGVYLLENMSMVAVVLKKM